MEENIKIFCFGLELTLSVHQLINLQPFITLQQIKKLKLPSSFRKFEVNLQVLHSCIYYIIIIEKGVNCLNMVDFRQKCLAGLQSYYIKQKMNFQLYQYGYFSSKILSYPLLKSLHIIYYLIYERLASKPYILNIMKEAEKVRKSVRKQTYKSFIMQSTFNNQRESPHMTIIIQKDQIQVQNFRRELKKIFNLQNDLMRKTVRRNQNKRFYNIKKPEPNQEIQHKFDQSVDELVLKNISEGRCLNIPLKVKPYQQSSVINRLKLHSGNTNPLQNNDLHKHKLRRQKFKENFNLQEKYQNIRKTQKPLIKKQWGTQKTIQVNKAKEDINTQRVQLHQYEFYRDVNYNIKTINHHLEQIRTECIYNHEMNNNIVNKQEENRLNHEFVSETGVNTPTLVPNRSQNSILCLGKLRLDGQQNMFQQMKMGWSMLKTQNPPKKQLEKVLVERTPRIIDPSNYIITRKNDKMIQQEQHTSFFSQNVKSKYKLQKYKQQYRNFLKNQLSQKIKIPS